MEASVAAPRAPALRSPRLLRAASDEKLVALVRDGHDAAFEVIYDRHHRGLVSFCRHMLSSAEEGEDAVQQTFLSAYRNLRDSSKPIQLKPWLYAIARNRCLSMLRARREQATGEDFDVPTEGLAEEVQRRSDLKELLVDLRQLPDDQREALVLAEIGSLAHDEIAEVIGVPKTKVKALVFQARESLITSKTARETPCHEIREQLSTLRGGALRRGNLRRHLRDCHGCRDYRSHVEAQRAALALVIPVIPSLALKHASLPAALAAKLGGGGGAAGGGLAAAGAKGVGVKLLTAAALAAAGTAGTVVAVDTFEGHGSGSHGGGDASAQAAPAPPGAGPAARAGAPGSLAGATVRPGRRLRAHPPAASARHHRHTTSSATPSPSSSTPAHATTSAIAAAGGSSSSTHGRSAAAPGHSGAGHGRSAYAPGHAGGSRGRSGSAPGHARSHGGGRQAAPARRPTSAHPAPPSPATPHAVHVPHVPQTDVSVPRSTPGVAHRSVRAG